MYSQTSYISTQAFTSRAGITQILQFIAPVHDEAELEQQRTAVTTDDMRTIASFLNKHRIKV
jgi:hypothetical protein